ncbi:MAG: (d)CMP kinase [Atopobiaceae bacterium]
MRIAIDGPAGSGKSTVAKALAKKRGLTYLDTGAMYRACALRAERQGVDFTDPSALAACAKEAKISFGPFAEKTQVFLDGEDVSDAIRTAEVDRDVSVVAGIPEIRKDMVARQQALGASGDVVAEGRDIGTVVFPDAEVKVFLVANAEARAHRRAVERAGGDMAKGETVSVDPANEEAILKDMARRDKADSSRASFKLEPAPGAVTIDSSDMTVEEVVDRISSLMDEAAAKAKASEAPAEEAAAVPAEKKAPAKEEAPARTAETKPKAKTPKQAEPMKAFHRIPAEDYYEHPMRQFPWPSRAWLAISMTGAWIWTKIFFPWKIEEAEKLWGDWKPGDKGRVIVMNHVSMLDPVVVAIALYHHHIRTRPISKSEFDKNGFVHWAFSRYGCIPVVRGTADVKAIRRAQRALEAGDWVLIFPEGTRIKTDDQPVTIHGGFALIAQMARTSVQPLAIVGARDITPKGKHFPRPKRVFMKAGDPIEFSSLGVKKRKEQIAAMEKVSMEKVYELRDELRQEHPGKM